MTGQRATLRVAWNNMKQRCYNEARPDYLWYGARGIGVCEEWLESFPAFMAWALANGYRTGLTLDRIETNGNYCPENCRWATRKTQANNRRSNRFLTMDGRTLSMKQWSEELGMDNTTLWRRLHKGWPVERALTEPIHTEKRRKMVRGCQG